MNLGDKSETVSASCPNPGCVYIAEQQAGMEKKLEHELWRAAQALQRARAIRICASVVLYSTAFFYLVFSQDMWARAGALVMVLATFKAIHLEG